MTRTFWSSSQPLGQVGEQLGRTFEGDHGGHQVFPHRRAMTRMVEGYSEESLPVPRVGEPARHPFDLGAPHAQPPGGIPLQPQARRTSLVEGQVDDAGLRSRDPQGQM